MAERQFFQIDYDVINLKTWRGLDEGKDACDLSKPADVLKLDFLLTIMTTNIWHGHLDIN